MGKLKLLLVILTPLCVLAVAFITFKVVSQQDSTPYKKFLLHSPKGPFFIEKVIFTSEKYRLVIVRHIFDNNVGLGLVDEDNNLIKWLPERINYEGSKFQKIADHLEMFSTENLGSDDFGTHFSLRFANSGTAGVRPFYIFKINQDFSIELVLELINSSSWTEITDLDNDGTREVVHEYSLSGSGVLERSVLRWVDVYHVKDGVGFKVNSEFPELYKELLTIYEKGRVSRGAVVYLIILDCLEGHAESVIAGEFSDASECEDALLRRDGH